MQPIALICDDPILTDVLISFRDDRLKINFHIIPSNKNLERIVEHLELFNFAGALIFDTELQPRAFKAANRSSLDAQEVTVADALTVVPGGVVAEYNFGRAIGDALKAEQWNAKNANVVILGTGVQARATSRELSSLGASHLTVLAPNQPIAEKTAIQLAASTEVVAKAQSDPLAASFLERADLLIRIDEEMNIPMHLLGPHLTVVDISTEPFSPLRQRAFELGALTIGLRDVQAYLLTRSLGHILGGRISSEPFLNLLHSL